MSIYHVHVDSSLSVESARACLWICLTCMYVCMCRHQCHRVMLTLFAHQRAVLVSPLSDMDIQFDFKSNPCGGVITTYLLEKARVVRLAEGENMMPFSFLLLLFFSFRFFFFFRLFLLLLLYHSTLLVTICVPFQKVSATSTSSTSFSVVEWQRSWD